MKMPLSPAAKDRRHPSYRRLLHWIDAHAPQLKAGFLLLWALTAIACGVSTIVLWLTGHSAFAGVLDTFGSVMFLGFFRTLFRYLG